MAGTRRALAARCAGAMLMAVIGAAAARADGDVLRIGIITDMSGQYSEGNGEGSVAAAKLAVEDFGPTVLGRRIEIISADHQNKPDVASGIVRNWLDTKGVDVVAEGVNSAVALAIQAVTRERGKIFLISGAGSSDITGKSCSPTSVQWTYDTYASSNATAKALAARGGKTWFFLTADYAFGHALERDAARAVEAAGGQVVGKVRHPFNNPDFSSFLLQAQASPAKVIALANAGSDFANAIKQAHEFGLSQSDKIMAALQVTLTDSASLGLEVVQGALFTDSFYWDRTPETRAYSERFYALRKAMPTAYQAGVTSALTHYLNAVKAAGTTDAAAVMARMRETPVNDFFAQGGKVRPDGRMVHDMYLMRFKTPAQSKGRWDLYELVATIPGDEAFRPLAEGGCPYVK
ncbi:ABC transporter substrate-binding protein [Methylobacterium nonmethylotrophicum]|uniref:ABC transporter substrate-binding protein n=1 Tax=Methylobacterium nonmethylotrophicum TaxID=1141884 RepID=A0A4Z0NXA8_9HYPH|nr:ABC transporter substrate-binding protein [Methylobacterium nonmethylotrophicum]TGE02287.1 ABC transporter substrate-binding protein [Methylobacterium nonmethylotrophicum]